MLAVPALTVTTRHSASLYPWQPATAVATPGPVLGRDLLAGGAPFGPDPWQLYAAGVITSPTTVVLGKVGTGKSALVKTYLRRARLAGRWTAVLDPKGEYAALAADACLPRLVLAPGGRARLNPLDPPPGRVRPRQLAGSRARLLAALAGCGLGRALSVGERAALTAVSAALPAAATLADAVAGLCATAGTEAGEVALSLRRLIDGDLAGMLDGATSPAARRLKAGVVIDLSAVAGTDALTPVMVAVAGWLARLITAPAGPPRILVLDEAWALLADPATTSWLQATAKLARSRGVQLVLVTHRVSDLNAQAGDGTPAAKQGVGLLADTGIRVLLAQDPGEAAPAARLFGLSAAATAEVAALPAHRALWLLGARAALVEHTLAESDRAVVDTDTRMQQVGPRTRPGAPPAPGTSPAAPGSGSGPAVASRSRGGER